jgi:hypothetical protein
MTLVRALIILFVVLGVYYYSLDRARKQLHHFRWVSPEHYDRILAALARFREEQWGRADIRSLSAHRATVSKHLNELKFRMPNDQKALQKLETIMEETEFELDDAIQGIRKLQGKPLEFPNALGTYFMRLEPILLKQDQEQSLAYSTIS